MVGSKDRYDVCLEAAGIALAAGDRADAERALRGAIQAIEGLTDFDPELNAALVRLAALKQENGAYAEAEELFRKALTVGERAFGAHDPALVPALTGIGAARIVHGAPDQAHPFLSRALDLSERHLGEGHPDLVILLNDLTRLYLKQSAYEYAEPLLLRLLAMKRTKGEDHPEVATVLASLATVRQALGRYDSAEQLWRRVLEIRERTLAPNHFSLAITLEHLAETCVARGKSQEALQLYKRALSIRELTLGADHASLRGSRERIADLQLQASEDSFDLGVASQSAPLRLASGDRTVASVAPASPPSATIIAEPPPAARESLRSPERDVRPTPPTAPDEGRRAFEPAMLATPVASNGGGATAREGQRVGTATSASPAEDPPYLKVLMEIKDELEQTEALERTAEHGTRPALVGPDSLASTVGTVGTLLRRHRAAVAVAVGVVALPLVGWAMAGVARSDDAVEQQDAGVYAVVPTLIDSAASEIVALQGAAGRGEAQRDSATNGGPRSSSASAITTTSRARTEESSRRAAPEVEESSWIPTLPRPTVVRLDSVVGAIVPPRAGADAFSLAVPLTGANVARPAAGATDANAPQRARLIGAMPSPRYPAQLLLAKIGGEVVVRFQVDTTGRPVMGTFSVISTPDAAFTGAVRRVIPAMRFEPARSPGPEFRAVPDVMEMGFRFSPDSR